jgi:hypothetical protein
MGAGGLIMLEVKVACKAWRYKAIKGKGCCGGDVCQQFNGPWDISESSKLSNFMMLFLALV